MLGCPTPSGGRPETPLTPSKGLTPVRSHPENRARIHKETRRQTLTRLGYMDRLSYNIINYYYVHNFNTVEVLALMSQRTTSRDYQHLSSHCGIFLQKRAKHSRGLPSRFTLPQSGCTTLNTATLTLPTMLRNSTCSYKELNGHLLRPDRRDNQHAPPTTFFSLPIAAIILFTLAFYGFLRVSEYTAPSKWSSSPSTLRASQVSIGQTSF